MHIISHQTTNGKATYEFLIEGTRDGSYRPYLVRLWGDVDLKSKRRTTALVQDGHNYYVTMNPPPRSAKEAEQVAKLWVEELDQLSSPSEPSKKDQDFSGISNASTQINREEVPDTNSAKNNI